MVSSHTYTLTGAIDIYFTDSGPPPASKDYITLLVLHGCAFNGEGFEKLHTLAHGLNLRTVIWNRREYPGSTKYTDAEIDDLVHGRQVFIDRLAVQVGDFIKQFVEKESVPKISTYRKSGGFAILGWSIGTATAMSLFSDPNLFSKETYALLELYVKDLILDDPPYLSFGIPLPADAKVYDPWVDPDYKSLEELFQNFAVWVSSYYDHPNLHASSLLSLDYSKRTDHATITSWTPEQTEKFYSQTAAMRSEIHMFIPPMQFTLNDLTHRVLYNAKYTQAFFPNVSVTCIGATRTNWACAWGCLEAKRRYTEELAKGNKVRTTRFLEIEGGNHFAHWDHPKELLDVIVAGIRA